MTNQSSNQSQNISNLKRQQNDEKSDNFIIITAEGREKVVTGRKSKTLIKFSA